MNLSNEEQEAIGMIEYEIEYCEKSLKKKRDASSIKSYKHKLKTNKTLLKYIKKLEKENKELKDYIEKENK